MLQSHGLLKKAAQTRYRNGKRRQAALGYSPYHRRLSMEPLEDRSLLSVTSPLNVVLISDAVAQAAQIRAAASQGTIAIVYHADSMTTAGLDDILASVSAAHNGALIGHLGLVAHGSSGEIDLGKYDDLSLATLPSQAAALQELRAVLTKGAELDLYSCSVAAGASGKTFVNELAADTGAAVFASDNPVGTVPGADFVWEYQVGPSITRDDIFSITRLEVIPQLCLFSPPSVTSSPYYGANYNPYASSELVGQCTWYVYGRIQETVLLSPSTLSSLYNQGLFHGAASSWYSEAGSSAAIAAGITRGTTPKPGAIACYSSHVAFVEDAAGDVTESNLCPFTAIKDLVKYGSSFSPLIVNGCHGSYEESHVKIEPTPASSNNPLTTVSRGGLMYLTTALPGNNGEPYYTDASGHYWFPVTANGYTGYAALLDGDTGGWATTNTNYDDWNFTGIQLSAGSQWIASGTNQYIYLPSQDTNPPTVHLTAPNSGTFTVGSQMTVSATASDDSGTIDHCGYYLYEGGTQLIGIIDANSAGQGMISQYTWTIPATLNGYTLNGTDYQVAFAAWDPSGNGNLDLSDNYLTIQPADTTPPSPNPETWYTLPYGASSTSISMTATTASDPSGVLYEFNNTTISGHDSGWVSSATWTDTGLSPSTTYSYQVRTRDQSSNQNTGSWSTTQSASTLTAPDTTPPSPNPETWYTLPYGASSTSISMTATTASDPSGVLYEFNNTTISGHDSGWVSSATWTDTGLSPSTTYSYQVRTRDQSSNQNTGSWSTTQSASTLTAPDTTPPSPNPETWYTLPYGASSTSISMTATTASDPSGVLYEFNNTTISGHDSGWVSSATWTDTGLSPSTTYSYQVRTRDQSSNQNTGSWSTTQSASTLTAPDTTPPSPNPETWYTLPYGASSTSISMTATTASDPSGVLYEFNNTTISGHDSGWVSSATWTDTGLSPSTTYSYQVRTRDQSSNQNTGSWSTTQSASTLASELPNLTPYQPSGWSDKIVVSKVSGSDTDSSPLYSTDTLYVDFAVINNGPVSTGTGFANALYIDGNLLASYGPSDALDAGSYFNPGSINIGTLSVGTHTLKVVADSTGAIYESDETDNTYTKTITVVPSLPNLTPYTPSGWSAPIVVSKVSGSHTDSSPLYSTDTLYFDFAVINNGVASTGTGFANALYIDGHLLASYGPSYALTPGSYFNPGSINLGTLSVGTHTLKVVADSTGVIDESDETDNTYTKTITVQWPPLIVTAADWASAGLTLTLGGDTNLHVYQTGTTTDVVAPAHRQTCRAYRLARQTAQMTTLPSTPPLGTRSLLVA